MSMAAGAQSVRENLMMRLDEARRVSDELFGIVRPEALYERPIGERHRILFYLGHLEAFDWNLLTATLFDAPSLDPTLDKLFASGIDPVGGGLPNDQPSDWPSVERVQQYNRRLREMIDQRLARELSFTQSFRRERGSATSSAALANDPGLILNVAIEHRLMHAETLAYMFHWLPVQKKIPQAASLSLPLTQPVIRQTIPIPAGTATLGLARNSAFGWDNEFEQHAVSVPAFAVDRFKVTNAQFLEFVRADGYSERAFWHDVDWEWKEKGALRHPKFWSERDGPWRFRTMFGEVPLPADCPVYVSHAEAKAYARWAGKSLPTEAQWHRAAYGTPDGREREFPWGNQPPAAQRGNFGYKRWDPAPVSAHPTGDSAFGVADLLGNGWEWTSTRFAPFPGFDAFPFYPGYSANFFEGQHYVMKGGSMRTAACMLRRSFRNWFQPHYPHIYSGFRCVEN
ncbi:MAG: SUMF1/EgtB/PvdO family nonheme iron enzyme [Candidatus Acidiferrales bacterium]